MRKVIVITLAPYPVSLPNGQHLRPGEITEIFESKELHDLANSGLVYIKPAPTPAPSEKRAVSSSEEN